MFWDNFVKLCAEKNVKPNPVAKELGISSGAVTKWKKEGITPNSVTLQKIADYFGVSVDYLLGVEKPHKPINNMLRTPEEETELNEYLEALHNDPNLRMMFSLAKDAKKEDVEKAVAIIKTLLGKD